MTLIVAIDTSTATTVVGLSAPDGQVLWSDTSAGAGRHGDVLLPRVEAGLSELAARPKDVACIAVGVGPGSFTGLRIGLATIQGWALALGTPVYGVPSPLAIAAPLLAATGGPVAVIGDAFKGEVALSIYGASDTGSPVLQVAPHALAPTLAAQYVAKSVDSAGEITLVGDGVRRYGEAFVDVVQTGRAVLSAPAADVPDVASLVAEALRMRAAGADCDARQVAPYYVRDADAKLPKVPLKLDSASDE